MSEIPLPTVGTIARQQDRSKRVLSRLASLRDSNRLAIHMVETEESFFSPDYKTIDRINKNQPGKIRESFKNKQPYLLSFSLIPSSISKTRMIPYGVHKDKFNCFGYLFDFSQTDQDSVAIARVSPVNLESGDAPEEKQTQLQFDRLNTALYREGQPFHDIQKFYLNHAKIDGFTDRRHAGEGAYQKTIGDIQRAVFESLATDDAAKISSQQLDLLGALYDSQTDALTDNRCSADTEKVVGHNEVVAAAVPKHVAAIVVPSYHAGSATPSNVYNEAIRLQAAIVGLNHIEQKKFALPVVVYNIDSTAAECSKAFEYVGQTRDELLKVAYDALCNIGDQGLESLKRRLPNYDRSNANFSEFEEAVLRTLKIDLSTPNWLAEAEAKTHNISTRESNVPER
jgi:hypothetical protein